jgi:FkbM family methyltransferase
LLSRGRDLAGKAWRYLLALAERPLRIPRRLWALAIHHVHAGELLHLARFERWLAGAGIATVIDAGAHDGEFAGAIKALLPAVRLYCFEPQEDCHRRLAARLSRFAGCESFCLALADRAGRASFHRSRATKSSSLLPMALLHRQAFPWSEESALVEVDVERLDGLRGRLRLQPKVLLKIDVQGSELALLRGARETLEEVDFVLVEVSLEPLYEGEASFAQIHGLLAELGFRYAGSFDQLLSPLDGRILQQDALFVRGS